MATDIVTDQLPDLEVTQAAAATPELAPAYTPDDHAKASTLKVTRLVELGTSAHGRTATFEFTGGFVRSIDLNAQTVWHSLLRGIEGADWGRLLEHVAPRSKSADGNVVVQLGPMWFWTECTTPRGRRLSANYFDVPHETYAAGRLTGLRAARDLIMFLQKYERARDVGRGWGVEDEVQASLRETFALTSVRCAGDAPSPRNAALTFCENVTRFFVVGAHLANQAYLDAEVQRAEADVAWSVDYDERIRRETAERMRAVRAAKAEKLASGFASTKLRGRRDPSRGELIKEVASNGHTLQ